MKTQLLLHYLNQRSFELAYESNPIRKGWEFHEQNTNISIKDNTNYHNKYYLINLLTKEEINVLWGYADSLVQNSFFNWLNGRCSLNDKLNKDFDYWNNIFINDSKVIKNILSKRIKFINQNN